MNTQEKPEIYWSACDQSNRFFLCVAGVDNNFAEVFSVEHPDFLSAHDTACRIARQLNTHDELLAALEAMLRVALKCDDKAWAMAVERSDETRPCDKAMDAICKARGEQH